MLDLGAENLPVPGDGGIEVVHGDGDVVDLGEQPFLILSHLSHPTRSEAGASLMEAVPVLSGCPAPASRGGSVPVRAFWVSGPLPATVEVQAASAARLSAALRSRSMTRPHVLQPYSRSARDSLAFTVPHAEQVLELG